MIIKHRISTRPIKGIYLGFMFCDCILAIVSVFQHHFIAECMVILDLNGIDTLQPQFSR